jgi:hypothetical protein
VQVNGWSVRQTAFTDLAAFLVILLMRQVPLASQGALGYVAPVVMSMTIEISSELEPILKAEAGKAGVDPIAYTHQLLRASLPAEKPSAPSISAEETRLLNQINQGLSAEELDRYRELIRKRQEETISQEDFRQLDAMTRRLEALQARRVESLAQLASLRNIPLVELMARLEIHPPDAL